MVLTSKDVSVTSRVGMISLTLKNMKSLPYFKELENITSKYEVISRDEGSGEILSGGNTFVDVDVDYKLRSQIENKIKKDLTKQATKEFLDKSDDNQDSMKMYNKIWVHKNRGKYYLSGAMTFPELEQASQEIYSKLMSNEDGQKILKKYFK